MSHDISERFEILIFEDAQQQKERLLREEIEREKYLQSIEDCGCCEGAFWHCNNKKAFWTPAMTRYHWDIGKEPEDPNLPIFLCKDCELEYISHWTGRWNEYYNGLL